MNIKIAMAKSTKMTPNQMNPLPLAGVAGGTFPSRIFVLVSLGLGAACESVSSPFDVSDLWVSWESPCAAGGAACGSFVLE